MMAERVVLALKVKTVILKTAVHQQLFHMDHGVLAQHLVVVAFKNRVLTYKSNYDGRTCNITSEEQSCNTGSCCYYSYCQPTGGYYNGRPTYYACGNCGCDSSPNFAEDLLRFKGLDCGSGGGGGGTGSCPSGYNITYSTGFQCYPVCYKATPLVRYGPMSDGTYDWGCYSGWVDTGTQCIHYLCP